ncbi:DUF6271 family protein [Kitasatospora sp. NPDC058218]|uniref:DUF6271 family protein n=1 Tax=Kitasatospora sp. NPDC058218 TaxID=3346385 RepID=UPI0036DCDE33
MRRTCWALPAGRVRPATIAAIDKEAAHAAGNFGVEVRLLILDPTDDTTFTDQAEAGGELLHGLQRVSVETTAERVERGAGGDRAQNVRRLDEARAGAEECAHPIPIRDLRSRRPGRSAVSRRWTAASTSLRRKCVPPPPSPAAAL